MKFVSHLDFQRTLQRAFRRASLETLFSQGFNPHQKMSYTPPLPLFATSDMEYFDVELSGEDSAMTVYQSLSKVLPNGLIINTVEQMPLNSKPLSALFSKALYEIELSNVSDVKKAVEELNKLYSSKEDMNVTKINKKHTEKTTNIRNKIYSLKITTNEDDNINILTLIGASNDDLLNPFVLSEYLISHVASLSSSSVKKIHKLRVE